MIPVHGATNKQEPTPVMGEIHAGREQPTSVVLAGGHPRSASTDVLDRAVIGNDSRDYSEVSAWLLKLRPRLVGQL